MSDLVENILKEIENKNYGLAIELCDKLIGHQPKNENIYELKAGCYSALKDYKKAAECYGNAIDMAVLNKIPAADISRLHHKKGKSHLKISEVENAAREFRAALDYNPDSAKANNDYSAALRRLDLCEEALEFADKAVNIEPDSPEFHNNRGNIYFCMGKTENAIRDYTKAIEINPGYPNAYFNRGSVYYETLGDKDKAREDWLKAIQLNPEYAIELRQHSESISNLIEEQPESVPEIISGPAKDESGEDIKHDDISNIADKVTVISLGTPAETKDEITDAGNEPVSNTDDEGKTEEQSNQAAGETDAGNVESGITEETENKETLDSVFEKNDLAKVTDLFPDSESTIKLSQENEVAFSDYSDIFDKKTPPDIVTKNTDDFMLPEFDFKSIFAENSGADEIPPADEPQTDNPVPIAGLKELHDEIQKAPETGDELKGISPSVKPFGEIYEQFPGAAAPEPEKHRPWYLHPALWVVLIIVIVFGGLIAGYVYLINSGNFLQQQVALLDSTVKSNVTPADTSAPKSETSGQKSDTAAVTEKKTETQNVQSSETKTETTKPPESKFIGYLTEKKNFALFSEPDGFYVQIGSFKDKSAANEKLNLLKQNNIKGSVFEADLKEKGILYRVRAGAFESADKAREIMAKLE